MSDAKKISPPTGDGAGKRRDASRASLAEAAEVLRRGGLVAVPTETVYGLAADATSDAAVARIYSAKGRPALNPLIAHVADLDAAERQGQFSTMARRLAAAFWPGPLTLVVPVRPDTTVCTTARAGLQSLALRVPAHSSTRDLIAAIGRPLAAPSANRSGRVSAVTADHVLRDLGGSIDLVIDEGQCTIGVESTIIACLADAPRLLRPGGLSRAQAEDVLGMRLSTTDSHTPVIAPGLLASHYAPRARVHLNVTSRPEGAAVLDFAGQIGPGPHTLDLSPSGDLAEASHNLFAYLRSLDELNVRDIVVAPVPSNGLGEALNDRLKRAAAPRGDMI
jgi:L-threonylcarbamoyladenylate synthase